MKTFRGPLACCLVLVLAGCAASLPKVKPKDLSLTEYSSDIRWSEFGAAMNYIDPKVRVEHPLTDLELARLKLIQVTSYDVKGTQTLPDGTLLQVVEIGVINRNTQVERIVSVDEIWRWDEEAKQYWLMSGLPDFTANK